MKRIWRIGFLCGILLLAALLIRLWMTPIPPTGDDCIAPPVEFSQTDLYIAGIFLLLAVWALLERRDET